MFPFDPARTRVFLCGSPAMIGLPDRTTDGEVHFPEAVGMVEVLVHQGFRLASPHQPGNIYVERYW
jgi:ferredoxin--NADP+ reductase